MPGISSLPLSQKNKKPLSLFLPQVMSFIRNFVLFFNPPSDCWQPVLLHTFVYNRQQKCFLFHVTAIINLTGQSANNSCCTVFNCSRASGEQHKHPPLLMKQTWCESCVTYLPFYLMWNFKGQTLTCLLYACL